MDKQIATEVALGIIIVLAIIVGGAVWFLANTQEQIPEITIKDSQPATPMQTADENTDWQTYRNDEIGIEFKYTAKTSKIVEEKSEDGKSIWVEIDLTRENTDETYNISLSFAAFTTDYISQHPLFPFVPEEDWSADAACPYPIVYNNERSSCTIMDVAGEKAVWDNFITPSDHGLPRAGTEISFNNKSPSQFKRLLFFVIYLEIVDELSQIWDGDPLNENDYMIAESKAKEYSKNIMERKNLPNTVSEKLKLVDQILSTFKFTK